MDSKELPTQKRVVDNPTDLLKGLNDLIVTYGNQTEFESCINLIGKKKGKN